MKLAYLLTGLLVATHALAQTPITADDMMKAVDQMTPEQSYQFSQKLEAKLWQPVPQGFFARMAVDVGMMSASMDKVDLSSLRQSGGQRDVEEVGGLEMGILWQVLNPRLRAGLRFEGWGNTDSNLGPGGYTRAELMGGNMQLVVHYEWVKRTNGLLWTELGAGAEAVTLDLIDTPIGEATTGRQFDLSYGLLKAQLGASWRINPALSLYAGAGYRVADSVNLDEGGQESSVKLDATGASGRLGFGVNF